MIRLGSTRMGCAGYCCLVWLALGRMGRPPRPMSSVYPSRQSFDRVPSSGKGDDPWYPLKSARKRRQSIFPAAAKLWAGFEADLGNEGVQSRPEAYDDRSSAG